MAKALFLVPIVRVDLYPLWRDFWESGNPSRAAIEANRNGALGQNAEVTARNATEAAALAEAKNPGHMAIKSAIQRLGNV
jgi:hypothetical protein